MLNVSDLWIIVKLLKFQLQNPSINKIKSDFNKSSILVVINSINENLSSNCRICLRMSCLLNLTHRCKVECPEYLASRRKYLLSCRLLVMKKTHQRCEIWFFKFARQCVLPTLFYAYIHYNKVLSFLIEYGFQRPPPA